MEALKAMLDSICDHAKRKITFACLQISPCVLSLIPQTSAVPRLLLPLSPFHTYLWLTSLNIRLSFLTQHHKTGL